MFSRYKRKVLESSFVEETLINSLQVGAIPAHIAFIMDGNRRYAKAHGMPVAQGHFFGGVALKRTIHLAFSSGVKCITVYAFSLENFHRPKEQVDDLMALIKWQLSQIIQSAEAREKESPSFAVKVLGRLDLLSADLRETIQTVEEMTRHSERTVNLCIAYTSHEEMSRAVRGTVEECYRGRLTCSSVTAETLSARMYTGADPPIDILVRTSGVYRLSDFMLWQCHQDTDIQIVDGLWPDFGVWDLFLVILRWQRKRTA
ncbi:dehydrodolichyl diphosphate syntase complex subunit SPAC4D7.04c [Penicillium verhagenii]|uniref:dehydrodolichyl diphosphate syntase complex subunit SPAC4D7.04c n=1 Tax=Penicillium verhagenii TaxID=1562060 RepID=UPI0025458372|nr:dehydrodolichyl diphosphate syntase complex subunit SPAC4D7.04c [Penicillium verhagenii]KAJ5936841.1 dehydrodolichyl diphosphate syntase complex subunit SPAC4D7.04c [Penicillium verhagenii]